jgi:Tfp pilus assembly protein PilN
MVRFATTFLCLLFLSTATTAEPSTREELLARREQRKNEFGGRLNELKQRMEEHQTGLQDQGELLKLERKRQAYERKLEHLNQDIDDRVRTVQ